MVRHKKELSISASIKAQFIVQPYKSATQQSSIAFLLQPGTKTKKPAVITGLKFIDEL